MQGYTNVVPAAERAGPAPASESVGLRHCLCTTRRHDESRVELTDSSIQCEDFNGNNCRFFFFVLGIPVSNFCSFYGICVSWIFQPLRVAHGNLANFPEFLRKLKFKFSVPVSFSVATFLAQNLPVFKFKYIQPPYIFEFKYW